MKRVTVFLIIILLGMSACSSSGGTASKIGKDFRKGTQALLLNYLPNSPPPELFDTDEFVIGLEVRNKGASKVTDGKIYLSGFDPKTFKKALSGEGFSGNSIGITDLEGKTFYNQEGGYGVYSIMGGLASLNVNSYSPTILATACYTYTTEASGDVCIDPDPYSTKIKEKACTTSNIAMSGGQGGPIEVTAIQVDSTNSDIRITFQIKNSGGGLVFDKTKLVGCDPFSKDGIGMDAKNKITVDSVLVGMDTDLIKAQGACQPKGELKLYDGQAVLMCKYTFPQQQGAYKTPVTIKLSYGYRSSTARTVKIIKTPT